VKVRCPVAAPCLKSIVIRLTSSFFKAAPVFVIEAVRLLDNGLGIFIDGVDRRLKDSYRSSPAWLKSLMTGWSDGLNYFLSKHPGVTPKVIRRFEPWMALSFTEGSIGGDIESVNLRKLREFYPALPAAASAALDPATPPHGFSGLQRLCHRSEPQRIGHALLWINPHTSYYFRSELQMVSEQGLNVYGAVDLGSVLRLPGLQQPQRLDAHLVRRRRHR